ncbi:MAG: glycosyltransferase family 4 protein [Clostridiales Family XIII bacterium]|jgi:glycosyltransferase involved in cell wall biosynthesis|nr:glycosyltransferase family 4 protein [Clostridiales Family XIII bacterium]
MTRILFVSHTSELSGGGELSLYENILQVQKRGYECHVALPCEGLFSQRLIEYNIPFSTIPFIWACVGDDITDDSLNQIGIALQNADAMTAFVKVLERVSPDVVITNTIVMPWASYICKALGIGNIILLHEWIMRADFPRMLPSPKEYLANINLSADWVLYNSYYTQQQYADYITTKKTSILYPKVDLDRQKINRLYVENVLSDTLSILIPGAIETNKNQYEALSAVKFAIDQGVDINRVTLIGVNRDDVYDREIRSYIQDNNLVGIVKIEEFSEDIYRIMNEYNIVIVPSIDESFGRVTLEAQLLGRIVIGRNSSGGTVELIQDRVTGLLYQHGKASSLAEAIQWVFENKSSATQIAKSAMTIQGEKFLDYDTSAPLFDAINSVKTICTNNHRIKTFDPLYSMMCSRNHQLAQHHSALATLNATQAELASMRLDVERMNVEIDVIQAELSATQTKLYDMLQSKSYKLGSILLSPFIMIKRFINNH